MLTTKKISNDTVILQSGGIIVSDMDGEKVMMSIEKGKYFNLGVIGGAIWEEIKSPVSVNELISNLLKQYDVEYNVCHEQVIDFLMLLFNEGLIEVGDNK